VCIGVLHAHKPTRVVSLSVRLLILRIFGLFHN
jgi:hypothetical protein